MKKYDLIISGTIGMTISGAYVRYFLTQNANRPVSIAVCSLGGYVSDGMAIYQAIKDHGQCSVRFIGMSASAATFLAMGAQRVTIARNALLLIHNAAVDTLAAGSFNKEQLAALQASLGFQAGQLATIDDTIAQIYADRAQRPADDIKAAMANAAWMKPQEAKALGIVDDVDGAEDIPAAAQPSNDLLATLNLPAPQPAKPTLMQRIVDAIRAALDIDEPTDTDTEQTTTTQTEPSEPEPADEQQATEQPAAAADQQPEPSEPQPDPADELRQRLAQTEERLAQALRQVEALKAAPPSTPAEPPTPETSRDELAARLRDIMLTV